MIFLSKSNQPFLSDSDKSSAETKFFYYYFKSMASNLVDHLCYLCLVFVKLSRLFIVLPSGHLLGKADLLALVCDV